VAAAEGALREGGEDAAVSRLEEADALVADWPMDLLRREDASEILARLEAARTALYGRSDDAGLKGLDDPAPLTGDSLRSELDAVEAAEAGAVFDFPIDLNDKVLAWVAAFSGRSKGTIENSLSRGTRYIPMIRRILAEEGVPLDLAYLPIVESGFRNEARSWAKAVGMWQFIGSTGRIYGLRQDSWIDERRDPVKSTRAAARYLKHLYGQLDDWYLALAGYNAGPGSVARAVQGTGSRNFWDHARSKYLWNDTKNYVPQLCAAILVGRHPERFGMDVAQLEPLAYETVEVQKPVGLRALSQDAGLDPDELRALNPELLRGTTPPRSYSLKVPVGKTAEVSQALASMPAAERLEFRQYRIARGDTPAKVAARYKTTPEELLEYNNMTRSQFRAGRVISVPVVLNLAQRPRGPRAPAKK
jgi:membrane-bound lytic murein transglycosylase D